jgi:hypothetical protein
MLDDRLDRTDWSTSTRPPVTTSAVGRIAASAAQLVASHLEPANLSSAVVELELDGTSRVARLARSPEDLAIAPTMIEELNGVLAPLHHADAAGQVAALVIVLIDGSTIRTDISYRHEGGAR